MHTTQSSILFAGAMFLGMVLLLELGWRLGRQQRGQSEESSRAGLGAVEGAVFALMGLLVAFTFSGAASRFDQRRQLIVEESNAIGTAWLRLDLLSAEARTELRELFRQYLDRRLAAYAKMPDVAAAMGELAKANALQGGIWSRAVAACQESPGPLTAQVLPALNAMFDLASTRTAVTQMHPPGIIYIMLGALALMSSMLAGYAMSGSRARSWIHTLGFALIIAISVYVILDLEFPRTGLIRVDAADQLLIDLRRTMD
ncbi:MAG: DUF4239 domain-containing protein [Verrucomicrobia bacterium]|nr:DUF4239 domain-containing protein [Verrucomicrobiota bacterium]